MSLCVHGKTDVGSRYCIHKQPVFDVLADFVPTPSEHAKKASQALGFLFLGLVLGGDTNATQFGTRSDIEVHLLSGTSVGFSSLANARQHHRIQHTPSVFTCPSKLDGFVVVVVVVTVSS
uniref:Uncharacterized protein n=1 Tax=Lotharella globosa TaxID=91324 RepID=A0A7S3YKM6_9EUKA